MAKTMKATKAAGKTAADLKDDMELIQRVYDARLAGASFVTLESLFNLRRANGMTSYRMVKAAEKLMAAKPVANIAAATDETLARLKKQVMAKKSARETIKDKKARAMTNGALNGAWKRGK